MTVPANSCKDFIWKFAYHFDLTESLQQLAAKCQSHDRQNPLFRDQQVRASTKSQANVFAEIEERCDMLSVTQAIWALPYEFRDSAIEFKSHIPWL